MAEFSIFLNTTVRLFWHALFKINHMEPGYSLPDQNFFSRPTMKCALCFKTLFHFLASLHGLIVRPSLMKRSCCNELVSPQYAPVLLVFKNSLVVTPNAQCPCEYALKNNSCSTKVKTAKTVWVRRYRLERKRIEEVKVLEGQSSYSCPVFILYSLVKMSYNGQERSMWNFLPAVRFLKSHQQEATSSSARQETLALCGIFKDLQQKKSFN